jgi:hypothetical protein
MYQGKLKDKPNWFFAVAVPKTSAEVDQIMAGLFQLAVTGYQANTAVVQRIHAGINGGFHWKIEDGDAPQDQSRVGREGYAGCWIFKFSTTLGVPPCIDATNTSIDPAMIKCGHYVDVAVSADINDQQDNTAGLYLNPEAVRLLGYGHEISSGPSAQQQFEGRPAVLPAGASPVPLAPAGAPAGFPAGGPAAPAGPAPAPQGFPAGSAAAPAFQGTAFPTNPVQQVQQAYPGAQAVPGFGSVQR